ncbi:(Fe-S)-binding protein [Pseudomonas resinovorans]|uniref:(Fe-S)-binding protein n=1 Tax=Metapseudomonas resinovorans TaxID=53412 RepID=UPI00237F36B5|nr:(Fe-S)-binding protein [Pseudomonas resinovorans]MDE3738900.1 (Fe-S)-binding protein [Pseudomonas resinovorans]
MSNPKPRVALFHTCLVDLYRPSVGFAAVRLLEQAGCQVEVPANQTCCGQPAFNSGATGLARDLARKLIEAFDGYDYVVGPSGSCVSLLKLHYPQLLEDDAAWHGRALDLAGRSHELLSFLGDVMSFRPTARLPGIATYHDSCSGLRELGIKHQPRRLLAGVDALEQVEMDEADTCCGFGGTFCVKYPDISARMASQKVANIHASGADIVLGGDLGCLLNISGRLTRLGSSVRVFHAAEVLAGMADDLAIGEGRSD